MGTLKRTAAITDTLPIRLHGMRLLPCAVLPARAGKETKMSKRELAFRLFMLAFTVKVDVPADSPAGPYYLPHRDPGNGVS